MLFEFGVDQHPKSVHSLFYIEYEDSFQLLNKEINTPQRRKYNSDRHSNKKKEGRTIKNYNHHDFNKIPEVFKGTKAFKSNFEETEDK